MGFKLPEGFSYQHPVTEEWAHHRADPCQQALTAFVEPAAKVFPTPNRILEVGFGRGLNTAMSLWWLSRYGQKEPVSFLGFEPNAGALEPWPELPEETERWFPWWGQLSKPWQFEGKAAGRVLSVPAPQGVEVEVAGWDWIFLDLFSPNKHTDVWAAPLAHRLASGSSPDAVLTTYSCAKQTRIALQEGGWRTEIIRHSGFRDTLRARLCDSNRNSA